jgi:hypothetical protein
MEGNIIRVGLGLKSLHRELEYEFNSFFGPILKLQISIEVFLEYYFDLG